MSTPTNDLYVLYDAVQDAATAKQKPQSLTEDLYGQYAYDPYVKEEKAAATLEEVQGAQIVLDEDELSIEVGETATLNASVSPSSVGTPAGKTSDETVATVNNGAVEGIAEGDATITASVVGKEAECDVTVTAAAVTPSNP